MNEHKPLLCLDFDGVLHSYKSGWQGAAKIPDPPVDGAMAWLVEALEHFRVAIYSSRSKSLFGRSAMRRWLRDHLRELRGQQLRELRSVRSGQWAQEDVDQAADLWAWRIVDRIEWPWFKPAAFLSIDDRALTFQGAWPDFAELKAFRPWNKLRPPPPPAGPRLVPRKP